MLRIAVLSGKGGVGKTTCTASLAEEFQALEKRVGIMDMDLTGPNVNEAMHITEDEVVGIDAQRVKYVPIDKNGIKVLSMASVMPKDSALMIAGSDSNEKAYTQTAIAKEFIYNVDWGPLDILLIDMPPGTNDSTLNIIKYMKPDGVVIVTTPHSFAYADYLRVVNMLELYEIRVFKVIVNMAYALLPCPHSEVCSEQDHLHQYDIFNDGGKFKYENAYEVPLEIESAQNHRVNLSEVAEEILQRFVVA